MSGLRGAFLGLCTGLVALGLTGKAGSADGTDLWRSRVEADWLRQADPRQPITREGVKVPTYADAAGAVDGVKDGRYAFHTAQEPNPWWQVDFGQAVSIGRIVVYNRLDYAPGLHNADNLLVLASDDGQNWQLRYDNSARHFGGIHGAKPLEVAFAEAGLQARYVRLQVKSKDPIFLHLDEVEVYGTGEPNKNIARGQPADQSSVSVWSTAKVPSRPEPVPPLPIRAVIDRGLRLAADLRQNGVDTGRHQRALEELARRLKELPLGASAEAEQKLYLEARWVVRRLALSNPLLRFKQLLLVKRFTQETYPDVCLNHMPWVSRPGGDISVASLAGPDREPTVRNLLVGAPGPGHVHGIDLWWDADRVVFGYAKAKSNEPPEGWKDRRTNYHLRRTEEPIHIFEIGIDGAGLRQLTDSEWSDLDPTYLPNGDIAFVSERVACSLQCNEFDKDETSCNLYVMRPDGSNIRQLSVSKDGDYLPHCLDDGTIGYTRWEYQERGWAHIQSIWTVRPDGTAADALFKQHLNDPWALEDARSIPGTGNRKLVAIATGHHTLAAGPVCIVTPSVGMNTSEAIRIVTPGVKPPEGGMSGDPVAEGGVVDTKGLYMTPWPLSEKYFLVSYGFSDEQTDPTGYGIYLIDVFGNRELIYRDPDISCFTPIPLRARPRPPILPELVDTSQPYATCAVAKVTHGVEGVEPGSARYLRISHRLQWPYDNRYGGHRYHEVPHTRGIVPNWTPVRVIGTVPLESDGSAHFRVPADTPVYFQLLDGDHMELRRMRSFISFQPGESRSCVGCHETREEAVVDTGFPVALVREPSVPEPPPWGDRPVSFLRDIQPIFDKHCVGCHSGLQPAAGLDFHGGLTARDVIPAFAANTAYDTIRAHELVSRSDIHEDARITAPLAFGSHKSRLVHVLRHGPCGKRANLSRHDWLCLVTWIDANAPYHDAFINKRSEQGAYDLPADRELIGKLAKVHSRRCGVCHAAEEVTRAEWIDINQPRASLFLTAPLAKGAGGLQKCNQVTYADPSDPDFRAVLELVESAVAKVWEYPRRDLAVLSK